MRQKNNQTDHLDTQQLLELRFAPAQFKLLQTPARPNNLTPVMQLYSDQLVDLGFSYSHEIQIDQCIGKLPGTSARMLVYFNSSQSAYALMTDLYHVKSWVYFTHYFPANHRVITTCQPGALELEATRALSATAGFDLHNTSSGKLTGQAFKSQSLKSQWKKHQNLISDKHPTDKTLLMDSRQHLDAERGAYEKYTELLLSSIVLRQSDTQLTGFTHSGANSYHGAVTSNSAKRPKPALDKATGSGGTYDLFNKLNYRTAALAACAMVMAVIIYNAVNFTRPPEGTSPSTTALPTESTVTDQPSVVIAPDTADEIIDLSDSSFGEPSTSAPSDDIALSIAPDDPTDTAPERFVIASEEDETWRIAVENAEFYLMSNDGDPAPWIRTARKMATGFSSDDPRLARTYFLAAILERDPQVAEQRYNRALSIQTKTLGLYHTETAQTLEALAWVAESARDDLEAAITHQRLALNVYRSIFGEEAEDTRAARWKLHYFEDRLEGRRPKSNDNRRLLPALARFAR